MNWKQKQDYDYGFHDYLIVKSINTCPLCALMHCWIGGFKLAFTKSEKVVSSLGNTKGSFRHNWSFAQFFQFDISNFPDDIVGQRSVQAVLRSLRTGKAESSVFRLYCTLSYRTVKKMKRMYLFPLRMTCLKRKEMVCRLKLCHFLFSLCVLD